MYLKFLKRKIFFFLRFFFYTYFISKNRKKKFKIDFQKLESKIKNNQNFAYLRFSDGELFVMQNKKLIISRNFWSLDNKKIKSKFSQSEKKIFLPKKHQFYRNKLEESLKYKKKNYYKGISCTCCNGKNNVNFMKQIANFDKNLTFSNLFQNGNYPKYVSNILKLFSKKKVIIIANKDVSLKYLPFKVKKKFNIGENCFINDYHLIKTLKKYIKDNSVKNHIFLIAASSLSNLIIHELFKEFDDNTYLDVGSTLNYYFNKKIDNISRSYLSEYWGNKSEIEYLNRYCYW
jgi:hypothetical protein